MESRFEEARKLLNGLIGSKVDLIITSGLHKGSYVSGLEEIGDDLIGVTHPTFKGRFLPLSRNAELSLKIDSPHGVHQATVAVSRSILNVNIPLLWLKLVSPMEKVQRRMFVRVPTSIKASAFFLGVDDIPESLDETEGQVEISLPPKEWFSVRISDISLGGIGISIKQDIARFCIEGGRYLLLMKISGVTMFIVGKIVKILIKKEGMFEIGFAYEGFSVSIEKIMMSYSRQQELMARG